jgi:hypothetical protein
VHLDVSFSTPLTLLFDTGPDPSQAGVRITSTVDGFTVKGFSPMAYTLPDDKQVVVKISYVDSKGHPAEVDGDVVWTTSDDLIANVGVKAGDSTEAMIAPGKDLGQAQITATADADLGEGVKNIITTFDVTVVAGSAVAGTITPVGDPQPIGGGGTPTHPIAGQPGQPTHPISGGQPGQPTHPISGQPGQPVKPTNPIAPGAQPKK